MRAIPEALQAKLDLGATTLCRCWVLTRRDGAVLGFTDHDENVLLQETLCRAGSGLTGSEVSTRLGFAVDGAEISGALEGDGLAEADLAAGRYDAARIDMYIVDWSEPSLYVLMTSSILGEVRRDDGAFVAELRGLADRLAQENGRRYKTGCSADLGDTACGMDLSEPSYRASGGIVSLLGTSAFIASGIDDFDPGWFTAGRLQWTGGANDSLAVEVKRHRVAGEAVILELWQAMPEPLASGDAFFVTAGCDKRFATCRDRFANAVNFRGFPHIPGNDFVMRYAVDGEPGHDGTSLQKS